MKLARTTRGTSAPPPNLTSASMRLTAITGHSSHFLRPRHPRPTTPGPEIPQVNSRLGSPFAFHGRRSRAGTPSTVASITESYHLPTSRCGYWLRSSNETEWEAWLRQVHTPTDLRGIITHVQRSGDIQGIMRCHAILMDFLVKYVGDAMDNASRERLSGMDLETLVQQAQNIGFWARSTLPGMENYIGIVPGIVRLTDAVGDPFSTPPTQTLYQGYR